MEQAVNKEYAPLFTEHPRYFILMGGRGAGRSTVASQYANSKLVAPEYFRCAIMRYVLGDIRNSIYREITDRAEENGVLDKFEINDSMMTISYRSNSINAVGFKKASGDQKAKLKSLANYNCVIIEEADEIPEADFMQLDDTLRTLKGDITIIILLNPPFKDHWIVQRWFDLTEHPEAKGFYVPSLKKSVKNVCFIRTDYTNNKSNLSLQTLANYEAYKESKPSHYWNMVRGLVPETVRGKIYSGWQVINSVPHEARLVKKGLDFGYSNDPTAVVDVYFYNGGYILDELVYQKGLSNKQIADLINNSEKALTIADSAEPKSIDELAMYGVFVSPAQKGPDSVNAGIQYIQGLKISVTERSKNILKEYANYSWLEDKEGRSLNQPKDLFNHAMDAMRYALASEFPRRRTPVEVEQLKAEKEALSGFDFYKGRKKNSSRTLRRL